MNERSTRRSTRQPKHEQPIDDDLFIDYEPDPVDETSDAPDLYSDDDPVEIKPFKPWVSILLVIAAISIFPLLKFIAPDANLNTPADTITAISAVDVSDNSKTTLDIDTDYILNDIYGKGTSSTRNGSTYYDIRVDDGNTVKEVRWPGSKVFWEFQPGNEIPKVIFTKDNATIYTKDNPL